MGSLLGSLLPLSLGVAFSPLGIIAIIVVLLTASPVRNGIAFNLGWFAAIAVLFAITYAVTRSLTVKHASDPPGWVGGVHLAVGLILVGGALWTWRRGQARIQEMAKAQRPADIVRAAPQLPGWLKSVPKFRFGRCLLLGFALCAVNPVDASCIIGAAVDVRVSDASTTAKVVSVALFVVIGMSTIALPLIYVAIRGAAAAPLLDRLRDWLGSHNGVLTAGFIGVIGIIQIIKGVGQL